MEFNLDRICPECEEMSLIEVGSKKWECQNPECGEVFSEDYLDS
ncbi:hypothetical protein AAXE64_08410 [Priestia megaterium]